MTSRHVQLVLVTGLSGSGKSTVAKCFEDLGYYVVDNLPLSLLRHFLHQPEAQVPGVERIAVVTDVRAPGLAPELPELIADIDRTRVEPILLFLEASDEVLMRRFSETRRRHPLAKEGPVIEGIRQEREILTDLRGIADRIFDSSEWSIHEIRAEVNRLFAPSGVRAAGMNVSLVSFGFKYGIPYGSDLLFDVRYLPNPYFVPDLRDLSGQDGRILDYLRAGADFGELLERLSELLLYLLPRFARENRSYLTVAVGCTGGRHRSVAMCEQLALALRQRDWTVLVHHRDIARRSA